MPETPDQPDHEIPDTPDEAQEAEETEVEVETSTNAIADQDDVELADDQQPVADLDPNREDQ